MAKDKEDETKVKSEKTEVQELSPTDNKLEKNKENPHKSQFLLMILAITISILLAGAIFVIVGSVVTRNQPDFWYRSDGFMTFNQENVPHIRVRRLIF